MEKLEPAVSVRSFRAFAVPLLVVFASGCVLAPHQPKSWVQGDGRIVLSYSEDLDDGQLRPVIQGTINNTKGKFLIDTGAPEPVLTMKAIRDCGIPLRKKTVPVGTIGDRFPTQLQRAEGKVRIEFGQNVIVTLSDAYVTEGIGSDIWLGILDYRTLKAAKATINVGEKTLVFSLPQ